MEKSSVGFVFRNTAQEHKASKKYDDEKHLKMEKLYQKIKHEFEHTSSLKGKATVIDFDSQHNSYSSTGSWQWNPL